MQPNDPRLKYKIFVLEKMIKHGWIGGKHTSVDNIPKGRPRHEYGYVIKAVEELKREGFFLTKPTQSGLHISLNPRKLGEVKKYLGS